MWKRVIAPILLISVLWIAVSVPTTLYISWLSDTYARTLVENVGTIQAAGTMQDLLWRLLEASLEPAEKQDSESRATIAELQQEFAKRLADAHATAFTPEERLLLERIEKAFEAYSRHLARRLDAAERGEDPSARLDRTLRLTRGVQEHCRQLMELNERLVAERVEQSRRYAAWVTVVRLAFLAAGPLLGLLLGLWVAKWLHRTISQITITLQDAAGELEQEVGQVTITPRGGLPELQEQVQAVSCRIRQAAEELQRTRREAIRADRLAAVGQLAAGVAHELRNPLTSVKLLVQAAAQRRPVRPLDERQLHVLQQEITRMENTIQGLLDFARPAQLRRVVHDLRQTVARALHLVDGRAKQQGVALVRDLPDSPLHVEGDPEQLHQVFVNLALNAIEAMPQGGVLEVRLNKDAAGQHCRTTFSDTGTGIPAAVLPRLFEPFVTSKERGTGLGLAISLRIVQEHGGQLRGENRPEGGAAFSVELPCAARPALPRQNPSAPETPMESISGR